MKNIVKINHFYKTDKDVVLKLIGIDEEGDYYFKDAYGKLITFYKVRDGDDVTYVPGHIDDYEKYGKVVEYIEPENAPYVYV
jgi:hypothetical protein